MSILKYKKVCGIYMKMKIPKISKDNFIDKLKLLLEQNKDKRIVVVGTTCVGKTTLLNEIAEALDMDKILFPLLTKEESDYVCKEPWTEEVGEYMNNLARNKIKIKPGTPVLGTVIIESDLIVFLDIDEELLKKRTLERNVSFESAKKMNNKIKQEIENTDITCLKIKIK
jgi:Predicted GTPases